MSAKTARERVRLSPLGLPATIHACLFDLDGVLTDTARIHAEAWRQMFDAFLRARAAETGEAFRPLDPRHDYAEYIDGKPRFEGTRSFLLSRGIELPEGSHSDPPGLETVGGLANRKNDLVLGLIETQGVSVFPGSLRYVRAARAAGLRLAVVSASANCREVVGTAGISDLFDVQIDAVDAERRRLRGKPAPDAFLAAARILGSAPPETAVFEDSLAGVAAGRAGGFGRVVGVDRIGQAAALRSHGADVVVSDLAELLAPEARSPGSTRAG